jgi:hypothetical protein
MANLIMDELYWMQRTSLVKGATGDARLEKLLLGEKSYFGSSSVTVDYFAAPHKVGFDCVYCVVNY